MKVMAGVSAHRVQLTTVLDKRIDIEATYPTLEDVCNISKETTYRELGCIYGLTDEERRAVGVNLTGGVSNAVEICTNVFKLPSYLEVERIYLENRPR